MTEVATPKIRFFGPGQGEFESSYLHDLAQEVTGLTCMQEHFGDNGKLIVPFDEAIRNGGTASAILPLGQREFDEGENSDVLNVIFETNRALMEKYKGSIKATGLANWYTEDEPTVTELDSAKQAIESMGPFTTAALMNGGVLQDYLTQVCGEHDLVGTGKGRVMKIATLIDIAKIMQESGATSPNELNHAIVWHDTDIRGFDKLDVVRGLASAIFQGCDFAKASFTRAKETGNRLYGRVTNVIAIPFIRSLQKLASDNSKNLLALEILAQFRYPCAGEVALTPKMALNLRIPNDFGIEAMNLTEVSGKVAAGQVKAGDVFLGPYDHYHSSQESLGSMAEEVLTGFMQALKDQEYTIGKNEVTSLILETTSNMMSAILDRSEKSERFGLQDVIKEDVSQSIHFIEAVRSVFSKISDVAERPKIKRLSALQQNIGPGGFNWKDFWAAATDEQNWNKKYFVNLKKQQKSKES